MSGRRLKILISAYACEPGKGSEPEVGWQWVRHLAPLHDLTVLTRANNEPTLRPALESLPPEHRPRIIFHDLGKPWLAVKRWFNAPRFYYAAWQRSVRRVVADAVRGGRFDLLHHLTYARYRDVPAVFGHGVPVVWGPVGGAERIPWNLMPWTGPGALLPELARNVTAPGRATLARLGGSAACVLAATHETRRAFADAGIEAKLLPAIGIEMSDFPAVTPPRAAGTLRLLYAGNLLFLKGLHLAIEALAAAGTDATFTIIGSGPEEPALRRLAAKLAARVEFLPRRPRAELLAAYAQFDALLFPSLHDSGGFAVIEAMACSRPVIAVECGGPAVAVTPECGQLVALGERAKIVADLAAAIRRYASDPALLATHGTAARRRVETHYTWSSHAAEMDAIYRRIVPA